MILNKRPENILLGVILISGIFYAPSLQYGFAQDDFIHLYWSRAQSLSEFLQFFNPLHAYPDMFFFRPLSTQVWFFLNASIFGYRPVAWHIEMLLVHGINIILFYTLSKKIISRLNVKGNTEQASLVSALLYGTSAAHFLSFYFISAFQELVRTAFVFAALIFLIKYLEFGRRKALVCLVVTFVAALLCKETSIVLPILCLPIAFFSASKKKTRLSAAIGSQILIAVIYVIIRLIGFQTLFGEGGYNVSFSVSNALENLKWYFLWLPGLPEVISIYPSLKTLPSHLMTDFNAGAALVVSTIVTIGLYFGVAITKLAGAFRVSRQLRFGSPLKGALCLSIFLIALLPVLFLHGHRYPHYLDVAYLGILPFVVLIIVQRSRIVVWLFIAAYVTLQVSSLAISQQSHWAVKRAVVADYYYQLLQQKNTDKQKEATLVFIGDEAAIKEVEVALAYQYGPSVWFPYQIKRVDYVLQSQELSGYDGTNAIFIPLTIW